MPVSLHFNFKDVFRAARMGFSVKKMWVVFLGLLVGTIIYSIFAYIALLLSGLTLSEIWSAYRYVPIPVGEALTIWGRIFLCIGVVLFVVINLFFGVATSKITYEQLRGDEFYEVKKAISFAFKEGKAVILAPFTLILIIVGIIIAGIILGLIGKIPWFGEIVLLILSIPAFFGVLFLIYVVFALALSYFLSAGIVATTKSDTFDTLFEIFSTLNEQNWRFVCYEALLCGVKIVATGIFAWAVGRALWVAHTVLAAPWLMGVKYANIEQSALSYFTTSPLLDKLSGVLEFLKVDAILYVPSGMDLPFPQAALGFIFGIFLYFIVFMVLSYWFSIHWVGNTLIFTVLIKKKDDIDLLAPKEEEEEKFELSEEKEEEKKEEPEETKGEEEKEEKEEG
jgi:hypothetical protein